MVHATHCGSCHTPHHIRHDIVSHCESCHKPQYFRHVSTPHTTYSMFQTSPTCTTLMLFVSHTSGTCHTVIHVTQLATSGIRVKYIFHTASVIHEAKCHMTFIYDTWLLPWVPEVGLQVLPVRPEQSALPLPRSSLQLS